MVKLVKVIKAGKLVLVFKAVTAIAVVLPTGGVVDKGNKG